MIYLKTTLAAKTNKTIRWLSPAMLGIFRLIDLGPEYFRLKPLFLPNLIAEFFSCNIIKMTRIKFFTFAERRKAD